MKFGCNLATRRQIGVLSLLGGSCGLSCVCVEVMDDVLIWSHVVLVLAVIPWLSYVIVLLFYALSILYGSVSQSVCLSVRPSVDLSVSVGA